MVCTWFCSFYLFSDPVKYPIWTKNTPAHTPDFSCFIKTGFIKHHLWLPVCGFDWFLHSKLLLAGCPLRRGLRQSRTAGRTNGPSWAVHTGRKPLRPTGIQACFNPRPLLLAVPYIAGVQRNVSKMFIPAILMWYSFEHELAEPRSKECNIFITFVSLFTDQGDSHLECFSFVYPGTSTVYTVKSYYKFTKRIGINSLLSNENISLLWHCLSQMDAP